MSENFLKIEFNTSRSILVPLKYTKYHTDNFKRKKYFILYKVFFSLLYNIKYFFQEKKNTLYCIKYHCWTMITQNKKLKQTVIYWTIFKSDKLKKKNASKIFQNSNNTWLSCTEGFMFCIFFVGREDKPVCFRVFPGFWILILSTFA